MPFPSSHTSHFIPPVEVARYAAEGLRLRRKWKRGGTMVGVARARDLKNRRPLSASTILRMVSYFARHEVDKRGKDFGNPDHPSNGLIAWFLWGGDAGKKWVKEMKTLLQSTKK